MTVKELIKKLSGFNPDLPVVTYDNEREISVSVDKVYVEDADDPVYYESNLYVVIS